MIVFTVHEPPASSDTSLTPTLDRAAQHEFIRDGFSFVATVFAPIWLIANRVWLPLAGYVAVVCLLAGATYLFAPAWRFTVPLLVALHMGIGFEAASLRRWALENRGWRLLGTVAGRSAEDCERRFYDSWHFPAPVSREQEFIATVKALRGETLPTSDTSAISPGASSAKSEPAATLSTLDRLRWRMGKSDPA